jgi:DNA-binding NarL/FixJ family response regulator
LWKSHYDGTTLLVKGMRIVFADDHDTVRNGVRAILTDTFEDVVVDEAKNGEEAVSLAVAIRPDVIILDINMPVLDGFGAAKKLRRLLSGVPILFFTMHTAKGFVSEARRIGVQGFVTKEHAGETLVEAVQALLLKQTYFPV